MGAIAALFDSTGKPVESERLLAIVERMARRGPDGTDFSFESNAALGHCHFWTTPEEVGERQPLQISSLPFTLVFDGRLDNRPELLAALQSPLSNADSSDAELVLVAYGQWGEQCVDRLIGEFAFAIYDKCRGELLMARDAMGERTLYYRFEESLILVASEPSPIAVDPEGANLDEVGVAHLFAFEAQTDGRTLFRDVRQLLPAEVMVVSASGTRSRRYWKPDFTVRLRRQTDEQYAAQFRALLERSVRCRMRSTTPVGVQMSGGLDSCSVASLAARMISPVPLTTVSYVFDELKDCDERDYIEAMKSRWGIRSLQVTGDGDWPLRDAESWPRSSNRPEVNPFRPLKDRAYRLAESEGMRVLLTGVHGDELFSRASDWLVDLIVEGRVGEAVKELASHIRRLGLKRVLRAHSVRRVGTRMLGPYFWRLRRNRLRTHRWMTDSAASRLPKVPERFNPHLEVERTLEGVRANQSSGERGTINIELRHPFRDRRLVEFVLALPAHQSYNRGAFKHVLRTAMTGILPELIRTRTERQELNSLYFRGMEREKFRIKSLLQKPSAGWHGYVKNDWLAANSDPSESRECTGAEALVPWMCASYEIWKSSSAVHLVASNGANLG